MKNLKKVSTNAEMVAKDYTVVYYAVESGKVCIKSSQEPTIPSNEIWYKTSDGNILGYKSLYDSLISTDLGSLYLGPSIVSEEYDDSKGLYRITFNSDVTRIGTDDLGQMAYSYFTVMENYGITIGSNLKEIFLPNSVTSIGVNAFYGCQNLTSITIPNSVTNIDIVAFGNCSSLTSVTIPDSVTSIGNGAFYCCRSLTSVTIPDSVTSISELAFESCENLTSVTYNGTKSQWYAITNNSRWYTISNECIAHCTDGDIWINPLA